MAASKIEQTQNAKFNQHQHSIQKCNRCDSAVSFMDVEDDNYDEKSGIHRKCYLARERPYVTRFVSSLSQYALNASYAYATVNALEAALQLQMGRRMSVKLVDEIVQLAALYQDDKHTAVSDVYPAVSRYHVNLEQVHWMQIIVDNLKQIMDAAYSALDQHSVTNCVSIVLTKPPETIFLHVIKQGAIYIYDSHPRPNFKGSHVLVFEGRNRAEKYLAALWPFTQLDRDDLFSQQINMVDVTIFQLKSGGAAVQRMIEQYIDGHQESLRLLHKEQDDVKANKQKFDQSIAEMFDAFQNKLRKQQSTYQAQFDRQFDAYQQALNGCHTTPQDKLKMLRNAKQCYANDVIDSHDRQQFDADILQKLQKYDPKNDDVKVPADIFPSLKQQQTEMQTSFSKNIARILTLNSKLSNWKTIGPTIVCPRFSACKECFVDWKFHKGFDCNAVKLLINDSKHYQKCCGKLLVNDSDQKFPYWYKECEHCPQCSVGVCFGCGARDGGGRHKCPPKQKHQKKWLMCEKK